jgi:hypothetical protein
MVIEACTSIARKSGYSINNPAAGFVFQSSLSLLSRVMVFVFMPLIGYLADTNSLDVSDLYLVILYVPTPLFLFIVYFYRFKFETLITILLFRINKHGTFFKKTNEQVRIKKNKKYIFKNFKKLYFLFTLAYVPFYLAWPITIMLMNEFNDYRATVLGLSSIFNGINTIFITVFLDPKLTQLGKYSNIINSLYSDLLILRVLSALISLFLIILFVLVV